MKKLMFVRISRNFLLRTLVVAVVGMAANPIAHGEDNDGLRMLRPNTTVRKSHTLSLGQILATPRSKTLPLFTYFTVSSRDGNSYFGMMVGGSPFAHGKHKTKITTQVV